MKLSFIKGRVTLVFACTFGILLTACRQNRENVEPELLEVFTNGAARMNDTIHLYFVNLGIRENAKISVAPKYARESRFLGISDPDKAYYEFVPNANFIGRDTMQITGTDNRENRRIVAHITLQVY